MSDPQIQERLKARENLPAPVPAYLSKEGSPLTVDSNSYNAIQNAPRELIQEYVAYERNSSNQRKRAFRAIYHYDGEPFTRDLDLFVHGLLAR